MHVNLSTVEPEELMGLLLKAWQSAAPEKVVKAYGERTNNFIKGG
ncbi:hypothetical protein ACFQI7_03265 [Paenibacillus allorhizosphaerae]|nr:hypothetical protein [Paenibacillus allorhizosphaerae]